MLNIENLGIEFSNKWLLRGASYQFQPGEKIGLIGRNGAGKSTLLRILAGEMNPSEGRVNRSGKLKIAFFNQDLLSFSSDAPISEVVRQAFAPLLVLKQEIDDLLEKMEAGTATPEEWDALSVKQIEFETRNGNQIDAAVHGMLTGLGFSPSEQHNPYNTFSGGWRMRVLLAKMLLEEPDILLLDEPTNHLDLPSIQWLEGYLRNFKGSVVIVSHDRFFIDRMVNKVIEIYLKKINIYAGNYSYFLKEKEMRKDLAQKAYDNQQKYIAQQQRFIDRFKYKASKARQAQSKIKALDRLEKLEAPEEEGFGFNIRFTFGVKSGKEVCNLRKVDKSFGDKVVLSGAAGTVMRGDKIALIGANGLGKSTLLRIIAGTEPHGGTRALGHNVAPNFFAQHQLEVLDLKKTIFEEVDHHSTGKTETELRGILGSFMFSGDDIEKKIKVLSGGEKSRVALAKTLLSEANFLLLDEPTNHLDIQSIQVLVKALEAYEGTYVVVSHDRYFLQQVANKIWYIEDRKVKEYPGTYEEYDAWKTRQEAALTEKKQATTVPQSKDNETSVKETKTSTLSYKEQKQLKNRIKKLHRDIESTEAAIEQKEADLAEATQLMNSPEVASDFTRLSEAQASVESLQKEVDELSGKWEEMHLELEELESLE